MTRMNIPLTALQHIFIPDYEETIAFIKGSLEERDGEDIFWLKLLKEQGKEALSFMTRQNRPFPLVDR